MKLGAPAAVLASPPRSELTEGGAAPVALPMLSTPLLPIFVL